MFTLNRLLSIKTGTRENDLERTSGSYRYFADPTDIYIGYWFNFVEISKAHNQAGYVVSVFRLLLDKEGNVEDVFCSGESMYPEDVEVLEAMGLRLRNNPVDY